jgi:Raf kinase inhibitor-like YbhB/YbcL family protein
MNHLKINPGCWPYETTTGLTETAGGFMMHYSRLIKLTSLLLLLAGFFGCSHSTPDSMETNNSNMSLTSSAFTNTGNIPTTYCYNDGSLSPVYKNYSPPLEWSGIPSSSKSIVILSWCTTDANNSVNWVLYMPNSTTTFLEENASATAGKLPFGSIQGLNRNGTAGYAGPFPYPDGVNYGYAFAIYALDTELSLSSAPLKSDVETAMDGHVIGYGYITGYSSRMTVSTTAFSDGGFIPVKYTSNCGDDIGNTNPSMAWTNAPTTTRSYVIIVEDQNSHANWIIYNIPPINLSIPEGGDNARPHPPGSTFGTNYYGAEDYDGPYAQGELTTYYFRVYALDIVLDEQTLGPANRAEILTAMQGHILSDAAVSGKFINLELSSSGVVSGVWNRRYRYLGFESSINPEFSWNASGIPSEGVTMVFLGTQMKTGSPLANTTKTWVLYIPQIDPQYYEIFEDCSWNIHPGNWIQGMTDRSVLENWQDRGYDGFVNYASSSGVAHTYRFGLYVLASTLGIATDQIKDSTYDAVITAMDSATILNKAFVYGAYINTTTN